MKNIILVLTFLLIIQKCIGIEKKENFIDEEIRINLKFPPTIFLIQIISNDWLNDKQTLVKESSYYNIVKKNIQACDCFKEVKFITPDELDVNYSINKYDKVYLEIYENNHSYKSLFNLFMIYDRSKSENTYSNYYFKKYEDLDYFISKIKMLIQNNSENRVKQNELELKFVNQLSKTKSNNKKKGGGILGLIAIIAFVYTVSYHTIETDYYANFKVVKNLNTEEFQYKLGIDSYTHLSLIPFVLSDPFLKELKTKQINKLTNKFLQNYRL